jgi:hypothetical protein
MKIKVIIAAMTLFLVTVLVALVNIVPIVAQASTTVFLDPPKIKGTLIGENVTVNINVSNVTDLYGWQAGMTFNSSVLNCTGYHEGEFLKRAGVETWFAKPSYLPHFDNTKGIAYLHLCTLLGAPQGVSGSGQLAYLTFKVVGIGISDLHLTDVRLCNSNPEYIPHEVVDSFTVSWGRFDYSVEIVSNLTGIDSSPDPPASGLFNHTFTPQDNKTTFDVITHHDSLYKVTIPKAILKCDNLSEWTVKIDCSPVSFVPTESPTDTSLYFTYHNGTHKVEIIGTVLGKPGDLDGDGECDVFDIRRVGKAYGSAAVDDPETPLDETLNWNPDADLNGNGEIEIFDLRKCAKHYGATYP